MGKKFWSFLLLGLFFVIGGVSVWKSLTHSPVVTAVSFDAIIVGACFLVWCVDRILIDNVPKYKYARGK